MDASLSRASITRKRDPPDWNSYDHYCTIHDKRLAEHPFVDSSEPNTLNWEIVDYQDTSFLLLKGQVYCKHNIVLEVEKWFETRFRGKVLQVKGLIYRYIAWVLSGNQILRYHNLHEDPDEYHHRVFDPRTGKQVFYERLTRVQFPTFSEVLDEIELVISNLHKVS